MINPKRLLSIIGLCLLTYCGIVLAKHFWRGTTLPLAKVCGNWGDLKFNSIEFKAGSEQIRSKMACSMLKDQKQFIGKDRSEIRSQLGDHDGFYFTDMFPAYMIVSSDSPQQDSWQIVFLLDRQEKVSEVIVHKNCCEK